MPARRTTPRQRIADQALAGIRDAAAAPLDSIRMRELIGGHLARAVPTSMYSLNLLDPEVGLATDYWSHSIPPALQRKYLDAFYPVEEAMSTIEDTRAGRLVSTRHSAYFHDLFKSDGVQQRMRGVFHHRGGFWGYACLIRTAGDPPFTDEEAAFVRRVAPHASRGLRRAAVIDNGLQCMDEATVTQRPGVVVLDARDQPVLVSRAGEQILEDLRSAADEPGPLPAVIGSVLLLLQWQTARARTDPGVTAEARLSARGRTGQRYTLYATRNQGGTDQAPLTTVLLAPEHPAEAGTTLARLYGLSPREREVLVRIARGESTREIATHLGLSTWTIQEHVGNACAKVGVRTRRELLARIFLDTIGAPADPGSVSGGT